MDTTDSFSPMENESFDSCAHSEAFAIGVGVSLIRDEIGIVGKGKVIEVSLMGHWLGINILPGSDEYILVRPTEFCTAAETLPFVPPQEGFTLLPNTIGRAILWKVINIGVLSEDPSIEDNGVEPTNGVEEPPYIRQEDWVGLTVLQCLAEGNLMASGRINCSLPEDAFQDGTLGEGSVGVIVFDVFIGDQHDIMTHQRWPLSECKLAGGCDLSETVEYVARNPDPLDLEAHLGGRKKAPYKFISRKKRLFEKITKYSERTQPAIIREVNSESCCPDECIWKFQWTDTLAVRQRYFLKSFDERREYDIAVGGQLHRLGHNRKRQYVTLLGIEVCATAWRKIHSILKSTYHSYVEQYKGGTVSSTHGNVGVKRPWLGTVQAMDTIATIIEENVDHMPHQKRGTVKGRMDTLKFLPFGHN
jgi:hypothetical protein